MAGPRVMVRPAVGTVPRRVGRRGSVGAPLAVGSDRMRFGWQPGEEEELSKKEGQAP